MSDPRFAAGSSERKEEFASPVLTPLQQAQAAGDHTRALELRKGIIARLLADDGRRARRQTSKLVHQPIELFWCVTLLVLSPLHFGTHFRFPIRSCRFEANFFLTARDCCNLSQVCVFTFSAIHSNVKYWKRAFQCLGNIPLYINPDLFENDVVPIRRWSIIAMIKRCTEVCHFAIVPLYFYLQPHGAARS